MFFEKWVTDGPLRLIAGLEMRKYKKAWNFVRTSKYILQSMD